MHHRILFIVKRREDYSDHCSYSKQGVSTGLWNSARLVVEMLVKHKIEAKLVEVIDNNCIDKEVSQYKPTHVIIEALWVVPEKFSILTKLHPTVKWNVRMHSELPFIANEGIAMKWLLDYLSYDKVSISCNSLRFLDEMRFLVRERFHYNERDVESKVWYTPNYYMPPNLNVTKAIPLLHRDYINVGCFGAIRPLKNQLAQAVAALKFARLIGKKLYFHINIGRIETKGDPVLHNLEALFCKLADEGHKLIKHMWCPHSEFLNIIKDMDVGLQVSFTETFNIVSADIVACGVPLVASSEVRWASSLFMADPTDTDDIAENLSNALRFECVNLYLNRKRLKTYSKDAASAWLKLFK